MHPFERRVTFQKIESTSLIQKCKLTRHILQFYNVYSNSSDKQTRRSKKCTQIDVLCDSAKKMQTNTVIMKFVCLSLIRIRVVT